MEKKILKEKVRKNEILQQQMNDNLSLLLMYKSIFKINKIALRYIYSKAEIDI